MDAGNLAFPGTGYVQYFDFVQSDPIPNGFRVTALGQVYQKEGLCLLSGQPDGQGRSSAGWSPSQYKSPIRLTDVFSGPGRVSGRRHLP